MTTPRIRTRRSLLLLAAATAFATAACGDDPPREQEPAAEPVAGVVDSVLPMEEMLRRFRAGLPEPVTLEGEESRGALVERLVDALQRADTVAFEDMALGMSEWAFLYYPRSAQARPPYELPPGLAWMQLQQGNRTGVLRALDRFGGRSLTFAGYSCDAEPTVEGENRIWIGCVVSLGVDGAEPAPVRLFSAIIERGGRFAFLSYANDF